MEALKSLGINPIYLLSYIVNFVILAVLLRALLYRPILKMFEERRQKIEQGLEDARLAEEARANAEAERDRILEEARAEAQKLRAEASSQAEQAVAKIKADAEAEADRIKAQALSGTSLERDRMLSELRGQVVALAIAAAHKLIGESLDRRRQEELVANFFAKVPADVRASLAGATGEAEVVSAVPLSPQEQNCVREDLGLDHIIFRVDPSLLGGLRVRVGDKVVDGSVVSQLQALRSSLV